MLNPVQCKQATCPEGKKRKRYWDSQGLYLEVSAGGSKRWFYRFSLDKKEKRLALGAFSRSKPFSSENSQKQGPNINV